MNMNKIAMSVVVFLMIFLAGCATPSFEEKAWDKDGNLIKHVVKYENSTFALGKALLLQIGYDPTTYSPTVRIGYGRYESARVFKDGKYTSDMKFTDVNLFTGAGSLNHKITINNAEAYYTAPEVEEIVEPTEPVEPVKVESATVTVEPVVPAGN